MREDAEQQGKPLPDITPAWVHTILILLCSTLLSSEDFEKGPVKGGKDFQGIWKEPEKQIPGIGHSAIRGLVTAGQWSAVSSDTILKKNRSMKREARKGFGDEIPKQGWAAAQRSPV